jgi:hypothetical protein
MMLKLFVPFAALFLLSLSGCCRVFGLCASASVSTSISSPQQFAQQDGTEGTLGDAGALIIAQAPFQPGSCPD